MNPWDNFPILLYVTKGNKDEVGYRSGFTSWNFASVFDIYRYRILQMKIIAVIDTREYIQGPDDKFFPVPGSGDLNICDRCGKGHEIHYHIEIEGKGKVVGGGCAKLDGLISETQHKSLGSASMTLAKNQAKLLFLLEQQNKEEVYEKEVEKLELPEIEKGEFEHLSSFDYVSTWKLGDVKVNVFKTEGESETAKYNTSQSAKNGFDNLMREWKLKRFYEFAPKGFKRVSEYDIEKVDQQIKRAEKKIKMLLEGK